MLSVLTLPPGMSAAQVAQPGQRNAFGVPTLPDTPSARSSAPAPTPGGFPAVTPEVSTIPALPAPASTGPSGPGSQPPPSIQQYVISEWHGSYVDNAGAWDIDISFKPDGTFVQQRTLAGGQFRLTVAGRYDAQLAPGGGVVTFYPTHWQPDRFCGGAGGCRPINLKSVMPVAFQPIDHDSFQTAFGTYRRIGEAR